MSLPSIGEYFIPHISCRPGAGNALLRLGLSEPKAVTLLCARPASNGVVDVMLALLRFIAKAVLVVCTYMI